MLRIRLPRAVKFRALKSPPEGRLQTGFEAEPRAPALASLGGVGRLEREIRLVCFVGNDPCVVPLFFFLSKTDVNCISYARIARRVISEQSTFGAQSNPGGAPAGGIFDE